MYQQASLYFFKFRHLFACIAVIAFLMLISGIVTAIGSNTILNAKTRPTSSTIVSDTSLGPNVITSGAGAMAGDTQQLLLSTGTTIYGTCKAVTAFNNRSGKAFAHVSGDVIGGVWDGVSFVGHGIGDSIMVSLRTAGDAIMFTIHIPSKLTGSITNGHAVSDLIRPTDSTKSIPVISEETSASALATLDAAQKQEIENLQAAQLADNQRLDGVVVAGDPDRGGYPNAWNDAPQDSMLDSWGMYNRECVSYAAWKVYQTYGHMPYWGGEGNANQWVGDAIRAGIPIGSTPQVHSVAIWRVGYYGHAMWVEAVDGNMIYVSQYNYNLNGEYSEMWVNGSQFTYIYFN